MAPRALIKIGPGSTFKSTNCVYVSQSNAIIVDGGTAEFSGSCISGDNIGLVVRGNANVSADSGTVITGRNTAVQMKLDETKKTHGFLEEIGITAGKSIRNQL